MQAIKIATAQFENRSGDKEYNLSVIDKLSAQAAKQGAQGTIFQTKSFLKIFIFTIPERKHTVIVHLDVYLV